jgi:sialate O-acetylesterase
MAIAGRNAVTLKDVVVGDVWVCSGQSNMAWPVRKSRDADAEIAAVDLPLIRLFQVRGRVAEEPQRDMPGAWTPVTPKSVEHFSGVGYFFGRKLHRDLGVPVGLFGAAQGGTPAEAWVGLATLRADPDFLPILARWERALAEYPRARAAYDAEMAAWKEAAARAESEGRPKPPAPPWPLGPEHPGRPAELYNGMVQPLTPYTIRGVVWYQGESNAPRAHQYRRLFPALIRNWRADWGQGDFPFLIVQLANFMAVRPEPGESTWAELREAQLMTLSVPNTGMAVAVDVGERLALAAEGIVHGETVVHSGPIFRSMKAGGGKARLRFDHGGEGWRRRGAGR